MADIDDLNTEIAAVDKEIESAMRNRSVANHALRNAEDVLSGLMQKKAGIIAEYRKKVKPNG